MFGKCKQWKTWLTMVCMALIAVWTVKTFVVTTCIIPHTGMQNTLYEGEGVLVDKWSYGLRVPLPAIFGYGRIGGKAVEKGDVVVYNRPTLSPDKETAWIDFASLCISRCTGVPGDTLLLDEVFLHADNSDAYSDVKRLYVYPTEQEERIVALLKEIGIGENILAGYTSDGKFVRSFSEDEYYALVNRLEDVELLIPLYETNSEEQRPYVVPRKDAPVRVYEWNAHLLCNAIVRHEGKKAYIKKGKLFVEGSEVQTYVFTQNYYWMTADEPLNVNDSRLYGFVPESHIVGRASRIWLPRETDRFFKRIE